MTLFSNLSGATFSSCKRYRYELWRRWDEMKPMAAFVMLNPSTADEIDNDPTVERCQRRAVAMGYGGLWVANIFAYRSTDPAALYEVDDPIGSENDAAIEHIAREAGLVVCAWGGHGLYRNRGDHVIELLKTIGCRPHYLKINNDGTPKHPLYVSYGVQPIPFAV